MKVRLATALAAVVVAGYAILIPVLYESLGGVIQRSHEKLFIDNARGFARLFAKQAEVGQALDSTKLTADLLDTLVLHGEAVFAEVRSGTGVVRSILGTPGLQFPAEEDRGFGEHGDAVYFFRTPVSHAGHEYELLLGFDEHPTLRAVAAARRSMLWTLWAYLGLSMLGALALGYALSRPVRRLQKAARQVARGSRGQTLQLDTPLLEIADLADDLQLMRVELEGATERLRDQMQARVAAEQQRAKLEQRLLHRERLETVGTLAGGISHEFNNALVPIILMTEMALKAQTPGSRAQADLEAVLAAARRTRGLVKQILTFSRELDSLHLEPSDLGEIVRVALHLFTPLISPNVSVVTALAEQCPRVLVDRGLAVQLVMNLCTNGYQALQGEAGRLVVRVSVVAEGVGVELSVTDNGQGMDAATAARIFEPFFTTRSVGEGTGLGLSVVHGIVQSFGASINVESARGAGSTFRVRFAALEPLPATSTTPAVAGH